jgi:hypothetical protein
MFDGMTTRDWVRNGGLLDLASFQAWEREEREAKRNENADEKKEFENGRFEF